MVELSEVATIRQGAEIQTNYGIIGLGILAYLIIGIFVSAAFTAAKYFEPWNGLVCGQSDVTQFKFLCVIFWPVAIFLLLFYWLLHFAGFILDKIALGFEYIIDFFARREK